MSTVVFKYQLALEPEQVVRLPQTAKVLHFGNDGDSRLCLWAQVDPTIDVVAVTFHIVATGDPVPPGTKHVASAVCGMFVWHLFR